MNETKKYDKLEEKEFCNPNVHDHQSSTADCHMTDLVCKKVIERVEKIKQEERKKYIFEDPESHFGGKKIKVTQQLIEQAYEKLRLIIKDRELTKQNITSVVAYAIQIANEMMNTSKTYKVELAMAITRKFIEEKIRSREQREVLYLMTEAIMPVFIDTITGPPRWLRFFKKMLG